MSFEVDSQKIKQARQKRLWSQDELAEAAGLSERTVQRVENGEPASVDTLKALAAALDRAAIDLAKIQLPKGFKLGVAFGFGGIVLGLIAALTAILTSAQAGHISFADAGKFCGMVGLFSGFCGAVIGICANNFGKRLRKQFSDAAT